MAGDATALTALAALLRARSSAVADGATAVVWNVATEAGARDALLQARHHPGLWVPRHNKKPQVMMIGRWPMKHC